MCEIFKAGKGNKVTALEQVALQVLSSMVCPVYGDFYSFPWKRGPHDNIQDYIEAAATFDQLREAIFLYLRDFDFVGKCLVVFQSEDEAKQIEVKMSVLRFLIQMVRSFNGKVDENGKKAELALDLFIGNSNLKQILTVAAFNAKTPAIQAAALQMLAMLIKQILDDDNLDPNIITMEIPKVYMLFEKNWKTEPIISILCCNLMNEMLNQD